MSLPPWVSELGKVLIGPPPSRESEIKALMNQYQVSTFVDLRSGNSERVKEWVTSPAVYVRVPFTLREATGKTKQERKRSLVHMYMHHATLINGMIPRDEEGSTYIFLKTGYHEECFIGMALWHMRQGTLPKELTPWIAEQNFTYWLDEQVDEIELLELLLKELAKGKEGLRAFFAVK